MWEDWRYERQLKRDVKAYRRIDQAYRDEISTARRAKKKADEIRSIEERHRWELELVQDEIEWATSRYLTSQALYYQVPIPPRGEDNWIESNQLGVTYLSRKGASKVRADIRAEQKAKRDRVIAYATLIISLVGALTGVLGATIGVLAFLSRSH
jgi:hypothetical protein